MQQQHAATATSSSTTPTRTASGITFHVSDVQPQPMNHQMDYDAHLRESKVMKECKGRILLRTVPDGIPAEGRSRGYHNSFVGAALTAYSMHQHLILKPDHVWMAITTTLARYIDAHAEEMRPIFVNHSGQIELTAYGGGTIMTADYDGLVKQICDVMDKHVKDSVVPFMTCNFSTTTPKEKLVSKLILMGSMKNYFSYKMCLCCGLPKVTLEGTVEDWKEIRQRVDKLSEWGQQLAKWSEVLAYVLDEFVRSAEGNPDKSFWNRIATINGGGSGPRWIEGWILAFVGFNDRTRYILPDLDEIKSTNSFGQLDTNDVPNATVEVPVTIDDNGREYKTIFWAGFHAASYNESEHSLKPSLDWALIDVTP